MITPKVLVSLVLRYWGIGEPLDNDEREVLLMAAMLENEHLGGELYKAATAAKDAVLKKLGADQSKP